MTGLIETRVLRQTDNVEERLAEMKLDKMRLLTVVEIAQNAAANATPHHPANAAGTFAYQDGSWALRDQFVGDDWEVDRTDGIEAIVCHSKLLRLAYANVDVACDASYTPKPRSRKGPGAERASTGYLFANLPHFAPKPKSEWALYYLMVDEQGNAELTRPVVSGGSFTGAIERIYLHKADGRDTANTGNSSDNRDAINDFDPQVSRKIDPHQL